MVDKLETILSKLNSEDRLFLETEINKLKLEEEIYRDMYDNTNNGIVVYRGINNGEDFEFIDLNPASEKIENLKKSEVVGKKLTDVFPNVKEFGLLDVLKRVYDTGISESLELSEYVDERIKGWRSNYVMKLQSGEVVVVYSDDTDKMVAQEALLQAEKLRAVGELAGLVAHDFNNSMQTIFGYVELLDMKLEPGVQKNYVSVIKKSCKDSMRKIKQLQGMANGREYDLDFSEIDLCNLVKDSVLQLEILSKKYKLKNKSDYNVIIGGFEDCSIFGNQSDLRSVIYNMVKNSYDAMPTGGNVYITNRIENRIVYLTLKDEGLGMSKEVQEKIFDPFFSTKGFDSGKGMGMAGVKTIVENHSGEIKIVDSEIGKGSTIEIKLPHYKPDKNL